MTTGHVVCRAADARYVGQESGYRHWSVVDETVGAVHTGFGICGLEPDGSIPARVQSFEESFFVIAGSVVLQTSEGAVRLLAGDYGLVPVGVPHAWRNEGTVEARWAQMQAPTPRGRLSMDSYAVPALPGQEPVAVDVRDPRTRSFGHIEPANMYADRQTHELLAVTASARTALLVYGGVCVKMMVDCDLGAVLSTMFMVRYDAGGSAKPHDHPFEETYLILEGEVDAEFEGERHRLGPGDVAWTAAGCRHAFSTVGTGEVRWLETQAPQPPARHSYRFERDWAYLREVLEGNGAS